MVYNQFYDFVDALNLDFSESVCHDGSRILDLPYLELQIQENESDNTLDYYDNLEICDMTYNVSLKQLQEIIFDRIKMLK